MRLIILNSAPENSGFGRYANILHQATKDYSIVKTFDQMRQGGPTIESRSFIGNNSFVDKNKWKILLSKALSPITSNKQKREVLNLKKQGNLLHYTYEYVPPLDFSRDNVVTIHDLIIFNNDYSVPRLKLQLSKMLLNHYSKFSFIITPTEHIKKQLFERGVDSMIESIHHPVSPGFHQIEDKNTLRKELGLPAEKKLILSVSNSMPWKNLKRISEAVNHLGDEYKLIRVGPKLNGAYHFEEVSEAFLNKIYNACDLLLFPSLDEGFGFPVIEAFATGLPVVTSNIEPIKEIAGDSAIFIEPENIESILNGIYEATSNSEYYKIKGLKQSKQFAMDIFGNKMKTFYNKIGAI